MRTVVVALLCGSWMSWGLAWAADVPKSPEPTKEHAWVKQLVGEWTIEAEMYPEPGQPAVKFTGKESTRMVGEYWSVSSGELDIGANPVTSVLTIGYDAEAKKYTGTWVDSMFPHLWKYEGKLDPTGKILTLEAEGPCPGIPGKTAKFRDIIEIKDENHRTFSYQMQQDDGTWLKMGISRYSRQSK